MESLSLKETEMIATIQSEFGPKLHKADILKALTECGNDLDGAISYIDGSQMYLAHPLSVNRTITSTGVRISAQVKDDRFDAFESGTEKKGLEKEILSFDEVQLSGHKRLRSDEISPLMSTEARSGNEIKEENAKDAEEDKVAYGLDKKTKEGYERKTCTVEEGSPSVKRLKPEEVSRMTFDEFLRASNTNVKSEAEAVELMNEMKKSIRVKEEPMEVVENGVCGDREEESDITQPPDESILSLNRSEGGQPLVKEEADGSEEKMKEEAVVSRERERKIKQEVCLENLENIQREKASRTISGDFVSAKDCKMEFGEEATQSIYGRKDSISEGRDMAIDDIRPLSIAKGDTVMPFDQFLRDEVKEERPKISEEPRLLNRSESSVKVKEELDPQLRNKFPLKEGISRSVVQNNEPANEGLFGTRKTEASTNGKYCKPFNTKMLSAVKKEKMEDQRFGAVEVEDGDFTEEPDWLLVGRTAITGLSTTKGRKLVDNEIVHFSFPSANLKHNCNSQWMSSRAAVGSSMIVRFSTKRYGEIGRLPMDWARCIIPLVKSSKVKVLGRCIAAPANLSLMQEIILFVSFYIHHEIFTDGDKSSWKLDAASYIDSTIYPLLTLFRLLKIKPFQKAEFTPEDLNSRKRLLNLEDDSDQTAAVLPIARRGKACQQYPEQSRDEQAISESSLNKLVGEADSCDLEEMEPPNTLMCDLRPYQKQALYWMSESEKGIDVEEAAQTLHPCWSAYRICDERASAIYVNVFSGEATTHFPTATQMARGGILADAMGLGKTVMTIALILARPDRSSPDNQKLVTEAADGTKNTKKKKDSFTRVPSKVKGGTLIVCPMTLLGQWKDELETHSRPESISIFIFYGGDRTNNPTMISNYDVVLTTYGVLTAAYKSDVENNIFHCVDWYRVVLDEAHTIKSSKTVAAQAAYALSSHCRWCLTGTPLQNNLEDLFSLLCFLHVEPWCNWTWWQKLIQRPYENGDPRAMKLVKAILRPLMLRRTKETKDKEGRPILVLPPTDIQTMECEQSEAEQDFYDALFKRSKVQFDQFVAQGKVLHNYASILELLLRLRQCCDHPFLVMSRADTQQYTDLNKLAKRFLELKHDHPARSPSAPTEKYVEEVVEGIRRGENSVCPICLELADDPVLTPCAHRMCRECLLSSWRTPLAGLCPICRQPLKKTDLITCPSENRFRIDVVENWRESSKIAKLLESLEVICRQNSVEKSIVFSQWTSFLDLLEIPLKKRKIGYLRFDGKLAQKQRERILKEFNETGEKRVLLMSLKAGGVGLNLTAASNVFLMDPWWNPAVEEQAIMRIHRIGQKRRVRVRRFIVKGTIEERMQQVQARKQHMIAGALTDEDVRSARIEELKMLFR